MGSVVTWAKAVLAETKCGVQCSGWSCDVQAGRAFRHHSGVRFACLVACTCLLGGRGRRGRGRDLPGWPRTTDAVHAPSHRPRVSKHRPVTSASIDGWLGRRGVRVKSPGLHELQAEAECSFPKAGVHGLSAYPRPAPECVPMASQAKR